MSQCRRRLLESQLEKAVGDDDCIIIEEGPAPASTNVSTGPQRNPVPSPKPPVSRVATSAPSPPKHINWATPSPRRNSKVIAAATEVEDDNLSECSINTATTDRRAPSILSLYDPTADIVRRKTLQEKENPDIKLLQSLCKECPDHGEQPTPAKGRLHLRTKHLQIMCPCCFEKVPIYGNHYKHHVKRHFVTKSGFEEVACPYCKQNHFHDLLWRHIDEIHFVFNNEDTEPSSKSNVSKSGDEELEEGEVSNAAANDVAVTTNSVSIEVVNLESEESDDERSMSPRRRKSPERLQKESSGSKRSKETSKEKSPSATKKSKKSVVSSEEDSEEDEPRKNKSNKTKTPYKNKGRKRKQVISSSSSEEDEKVFERPPNVPFENPTDNSLRDTLNNLSDEESCVTVAIGPCRSSTVLTTNNTPNKPRPTQSPDPSVADRNRRYSEPTEWSSWGTSRVLRSESRKESNKNTTDESHSNDTHSERQQRKRSSRNDDSNTNDSRHGTSEDSRSSRNKSRKSDDSGNKSREKDDSRSRSSSDKHSKKRSLEDRAEKSSSSSKSVREWDKSQQSSSKSSEHKKRDKNSEPPEKRKKSSEESSENIQSHRVESHSASKVVIQIIQSGEKEKKNSPPVPLVAKAENIAESSDEDGRLVGRCTLLKENIRFMHGEATKGKATNATLDEINKAIAEIETFVPVRAIAVSVKQKLLHLHKKCRLQIQQFLAEQHTDEGPTVLTPARPLQVESSRRGESSTNSSSSVSPPVPAGNRSGSSSKRPNITQSSSNFNAQVPSRSGGSGGGGSGRKDPRLSLRAVAEQINGQMDSMKEQSPTAQSHQQNKNLQRATSSVPKSQQQPENRQGNSNRGPNPSENCPHSKNNPPPSQNLLSVPKLSANQAPATKSSQNLASTSNVSQYRPSAPKVSPNPASAPKHSQNLASVPKSVQNSAPVPRSVQNSAPVPRSVQNPASVPNFSQSRTSNQIRPSSNLAPTPNTYPAQMPPPSDIPSLYRHYTPASATTTTRPSVPSAQNGQQFLPSSSRHTHPHPNGQFRSPAPHQRGPLPLTPFHQPQNQFPTNERMPKYQNFSLNNNASPPNSFYRRIPPPNNPGFRGAPSRQHHSSNNVRLNVPTPVPTAGNRNVFDYNHQITNLNRTPRGEIAGVRSPEENGYYKAPVTNDYKSRNEAMQKISRSEIGSLYLKAKNGYCKTIKEYFDSGMPIQQVYVKKQTELLAPYTETQNQKAFTEVSRGYLEDQMEKTPEFASNEYRNSKNFKKDVLRHWLPVFLYALKFTLRIDQAVDDFVQTASRKVNTKLTPDADEVKVMFPRML